MEVLSSSWDGAGQCSAPCYQSYACGVCPVCGCCGGLLFCFIWYFSALLLCLTDLHMHRECRICLVYERGSRNLYSPMRRAVQKIFGLIFILAPGNFLLCVLRKWAGRTCSCCFLWYQGISLRPWIRSIRDADGSGGPKVTIGGWEDRKPPSSLFIEKIF